MNFNALNQARLAFTGTNEEFVTFANSAVELVLSNSPTRWLGYGSLAITLGIQRCLEIQSTLVALSEQTADPALQSTCRFVHIMLASGDGVDMSLPETYMLLTQFVASGLVTQSEANILLARGRTSHFRYLDYGWGQPVTLDDVLKAPKILAFEQLVIDDYNNKWAYAQSLKQASYLHTDVPNDLLGF